MALSQYLDDIIKRFQSMQVMFLEVSLHNIYYLKQ